MITDFTKEHPDRTLWRFWIPMMFSVMFQQIYNIADSMIAGKFAGEDALAAVGASYPITIIFMAFAVGMNLGASVVVSRLFGAGDRKGVKRAVTTAFVSSLGLAAVLTVFGYFFSSNMMEWIHTPQNIMADGILYLKIYVFGMIFLMLYNVCTGVFTALGDSKTPLYFLLGSSAGNIILDLIFAGIIVPWTVWKQFGDTQIIEESWNAMDLFMNHINDTKYNHETLCGENGNYQWADWLSYEPLESCSGLAFSPQGPLPDAVSYWNYLSASYWVIDASMMRDMAAATGRDAAKYQQMSDSAKAYIKENFLNEDGTFKTAILNTMQTPALFALKNQLLEGEAKAKMIDRLRKNFAQHDLCLQTGFLGTSILMATLTENGMEDIAYELLFQRKNPSWLYSVDNGATTIWERWNSYMIDKGMGPRGMNSFNHYAYGCVCEWIWETVAGIAADPATPGFKHIIMKPIPDKRLGHVTAEYRSVSGLIKSAWKYEGDTWIWEFTIPKGVIATVILPGEMKSKEYVSGTYKVTK